MADSNSLEGLETGSSEDQKTAKSEASMAKEGVRATALGIVTNFVLTIVQAVAGVLGNSVALVADSMHTLSDLLTDFLVMFSIRFSAKPEDESHNYGHKKIETLASVVIGIVLLSVGLLMLFAGSFKIYQFMQGMPLEKPSIITFYIAIFTVILKELLYRHTHSVAKKLNNDMIEANAWHHRSDAFSSIGVAAGIGLAVFLGGQWILMDPIIAILLSFYLIYIAVGIGYKSINELMEASLGLEINDEIKTIVLSCGGVLNLHSLKTRKLGSSKAMDMHIMVDENLTVKEAAEIQRNIEKCLKDRFGSDIYVIVKVEPFVDSKIDREKHILDGL
ncbi:MAG: cation diffusion facilitator family transporter [Methanimicrococcus sp.]|nr:cation diffusion facilitator family transporter [Methanimicrococcus sp.]